MAITDKDERGPERPRSERLTKVRPPEANIADETGSAVADNPTVQREEVNNTSDSSGLPATDEAAGESIKELLRKGGQQVSKMD
jgi:hypothetical protein